MSANARVERQAEAVRGLCYVAQTNTAEECPAQTHLLGHISLNYPAHSFKTKSTNLLTNGDTITTTGNATMKENNHELNQMLIISPTRPMLKTPITRDIIHDISNDIKNENTNP